eukprot:scaffold309568_cov42-Prasinocladus_malaysianus.AAC.1
MMTVSSTAGTITRAVLTRQQKYMLNTRQEAASALISLNSHWSKNVKPLSCWEQGDLQRSRRISVPSFRPVPGLSAAFTAAWCCGGGG